MVDLEQLYRRGRRAYEVGRLREASKIALVLGPVAVLCVSCARDKQACGCLSFLLLGLAVWLRWRSRADAQDVGVGLLAGGVPLLLGLLLLAFATPVWKFNVLALFAAGFAAGAWMAIQRLRTVRSPRGWLTAWGIAALTASLSSFSLGRLAVLGVIAGIALGTGTAARLSSAR